MMTSDQQAVGMVIPTQMTPPVYPFSVAFGGGGGKGGTTEDAYRWLENLDTPAVRRWVEAQNQLSRPRLAVIPARRWVRERLRQLWAHERYGVPVSEGGRYFFLHQDAGQSTSVLSVADGLDASPRTLVDPSSLHAQGTVVLADFLPSPGGDVVAYSLAGASPAWQFRHVADGQDLPDRLQFTDLSGLSWARNGSGVYYPRNPEMASAKGEEVRHSAVYFHKLGAPQEQDAQVYAVSDRPARIAAVQVTDDGHYLVITLLEADERSAVELIDLTSPRARPLVLFGAGDAFYSFIGSSAERLYFLSTRNAPQGHVIAVSAREPLSGSATVVPESTAVLEEASYVGNRIVARYIENAHDVVRLYSADGKPAGEVQLPGQGRVQGFAGKPQQTEVFFSYSDYLTPAEVHRLDLTSGRSQLWRRPKLPAPTDAYVTEQVFYLSKDGTRVPMYVTHRRDMPRDGNQPLLLHGYGGFNVSLTPVFRPQVLTWLEMGGVYAEANLHSGTLQSQPNVFDDFIAAAQYLISERYTRTRRLGIYGRGNGGLLIGAVMLQRPDLFSAVLPAVDVSDRLSDESAAASARRWAADNGLGEDAQQLASAYAYAPYRRVRQGICYPPTLITTAERDERIAPWHSYQLAASLQAVQLCANPILLHVAAARPAGESRPVSEQIDEVADQWAFLAQWLGMGDMPSS